ncbi:MAG: sigma-70 family RNA polymerase sigma factor [Clostridia bacterium]|nr:sigma-70 family RNA polymerase sigma factor [Clostridia bacterium]
MTEFEKLIKENLSAVERFVKFKISNVADAEDVLQEVLLSAFKNFEQLKNKESFRPWIIGIARNKCNGYYREKSKSIEITVDEFTENLFSHTQFGIDEFSLTKEIFDLLSNKDKEILRLTFFENLSQSEISEKLGIPVGTVKSRLHAAKQNFKEKYPHRKVDEIMKKLPDILPAYKITKSELSPFEVKCEELKGLSIIPKTGEKSIWGTYNGKTGKCEDYTETKVCGKAEIHGIEGVEITSVQHNLISNTQRRTDFVAQLTDTHCRYLAATHYDKDTKKQFTFLDDIFMKNWAFGENNIGNEIHLKPNGLINRIDDNITTNNTKEVSDITGRYTVEICGKKYDTVCVMNVGHFDNCLAIEQYIDKNGRTVLWRRFNKNNWAFKRYNKTWDEMLPDNEKLIINDEVFVHWFDCITDYIL